MKIIYIRKKSKPAYQKRLLLAFDCLILIFVMCFFGTFLIKQRMQSLENAYEQADSSYGEKVLEAIEMLDLGEGSAKNG